MSSTTTITTSETTTIPVPLLADFNYYLPPANGPSTPSTNDLELILGTKDQETRKLPVIDVRSCPNTKFSIDVGGHGFTYVTSPSKYAAKAYEMTDDEIKQTYYPEVEELVRGLYPDTKITQIHNLGHILRGAPRRTDFPSTNPDAAPTDAAWNKPNRGTAPAPRVHIDFTGKGLQMVCRLEFGEDSEAVRTLSEIANTTTTTTSANNNIINAQETKPSRRVVCFSIWRPIRTVERDPLGICDARTVRAGELVRLPRVYPDGAEGENVVVKAALEGSGQQSRHQWYWMSGQTSEEVLVIKIYDSADDKWEREQAETPHGQVGCAPHCSFHVPGTEGVEGVRESIETRVVLVME